MYRWIFFLSSQKFIYIYIYIWFNKIKFHLIKLRRTRFILILKKSSKIKKIRIKDHNANRLKVGFKLSYLSKNKIYVSLQLSKKISNFQQEKHVKKNSYKGDINVNIVCRCPITNFSQGLYKGIAAVSTTEQTSKLLPSSNLSNL